MDAQGMSSTRRCLSFVRFFPHFPAVLAVLFSAVACVAPSIQTERTQLQIREFQTRTYDNLSGRTKDIMKAVINVLQDDGFIITNADKELGFITARREIDVQDQWETFFSVFADGAQARFRKNSIIDCSVNISEFGKLVKVRAVFQTKVLDNMGGTVSVQQVDSVKFYQDFFAKVDKGIFLEHQSL